MGILLNAHILESCPSGRRCSTRNAVRVKPPRVRIPNSPPIKSIPLLGRCFFIGMKELGMRTGPAMNEATVWPQNRPDRAPSRRERRFPSPPPNQHDGFDTNHRAFALVEVFVITRYNQFDKLEFDGGSSNEKADYKL